MKRRKQTIIFDLDYDVLKYILVFVAKSVDGALHLAWASLVRKLFVKLAEDEEVLKAVALDYLNIFDRLKLFQQYKGLLTRCALAGNAAAEYLLAKLLEGERRLESLAISSAETSSFMAHFGINKEPSSDDICRRSTHYQLVRSFPRRCKPCDFCKMHPHMKSYFDYYIKCADHAIFMEVINNMHNSGIVRGFLDWVQSSMEFIFNHKARALEQLQADKMEMDEEKIRLISDKYWINLHLFRSLLKKVCKERGFNDALVLGGDFREYIAAKREATAYFETCRADAISTIDDIF